MLVIVRHLSLLRVGWDLILEAKRWLLLHKRRLNRVWSFTLLQWWLQGLFLCINLQLFYIWYGFTFLIRGVGLVVGCFLCLFCQALRAKCLLYLKLVYDLRLTRNIFFLWFNWDLSEHQLGLALWLCLVRRKFGTAGNFFVIYESWSNTCI